MNTQSKPRYLLGQGTVSSYNTVPLADQVFGYRLEEVLKIHSDKSVWFIDDSGDFSPYSNRKYAVLSAVLPLEDIDYDNAFAGIPLDTTNPNKPEVHFSFIWKDEKNRNIALRLVSQVGELNILIITLPADKSTVKITDKKKTMTSSVFSSLLDRILAAIDFIDLSDHKTIIIDHTDLIKQQDLEKYQRPNRKVIMKPSYQEKGLQMADTTASSLGVGVNPNPHGTVYPQMYEPLKKKSVNLNVEKEELYHKTENIKPVWPDSRKARLSPTHTDNNNYNSDYINASRKVSKHTTINNKNRKSKVVNPRRISRFFTVTKRRR